LILIGLRKSLILKFFESIKVFVVCIFHVIKHSMDKRKKKPASLIQTMERIDIENNETIQNEHSNLEKQNLYSRSTSPSPSSPPKSNEDIIQTPNDEHTNLLNQT